MKTGDRDHEKIIIIMTSKKLEAFFCRIYSCFAVTFGFRHYFVFDVHSFISSFIATTHK